MSGVTGSEPLVMKVREYAEATNTAESTVYAAIARGELPAVWVGKSVRLPKWLLNKLKEPRG